MLLWDKTFYPEHAGKVFHVVPANSTFRGDVVKKYGSNNVFISSSQQGIVNALARTMTGRNDYVLIYPGTYTFSGVATDGVGITVSKSATIQSVTRNPADVNIVAGADAGIFSLAATADGFKLRDVSLTLDTSSTTPQDGIVVASGCDGVIIDNCNFIGADKATVAIDSEADRLIVQNCRFEDVKFAIQSNGAYSKILRNFVNSDNTAAVGIELTAGNWCEIFENHLDLSGGTGDTGIKVANACLLGICKYNTIRATCNDPINPGSSTMAFIFNYLTGSTTTDFTVTNSTALPRLVYT